MKFLVLAAVTLLSTASFAANNSSVNDLQYLPDAGTVFGDTSFNYLKYSDEFFDGVGTAKSSTKGYVLQQTLGFALRDNFSLGLNVGYSDLKSESTGNPSTDSTGLTDITLLSKYRLVDSERRFDLLGNVSISPEDSIVESNGDSNAYSGGHSIAVGAEYGAKKAAHQWSLRGLYYHNLKATTEYKDTNEKIKDDAHGSLEFSANLLTHLGEKCFIKTFAGVNFTEEYDSNDDFKTSGNTLYNIGAEYQHLMSKDLYLRGGFSSLLGGNGASVVIMSYVVGAGYQF